jgi:hypothetical protein
VARGARPAPRQATGRDAAVHGASAPRPVAQPSPRGQASHSGEWNDDDFDVLADGTVVGRVAAVYRFGI